MILAVSSFLCEFQFSTREEVIFCSKHHVFSAVEEQKINKTVNYHGNEDRHNVLMLASNREVSHY